MLADIDHDTIPGGWSQVFYFGFENQGCCIAFWGKKIPLDGV